MSPQKRSLNENRWHIQESKKSLLKAEYVEWKYFNFLTPRYSGIFVYAVADPLNVTGKGGGRMLARVFTPDGAVGESEVIGLDKVTSSSYAADISMGQNTIEVHDGNVYEIQGKTRSLEWNLRFMPETHGIKSFTDLGIVPMDLEKASWLIEMPRSRVTGAIKINGETIDIDGNGYADSNWGAPIPLLVSFNWAQFSNEHASIVFMEIQNLQIGKKKLGRRGEMYAMHKDELMRFGPDEFSVEHLKWQKLSHVKMEIPSVSLVQGENKSHKISLLLTTEFSDPLYFRLPLSIPIEPVIVEQIASFHGTLLRKEERKEVPLCSIEGRGFKEYTLRNLALTAKSKSGVVIE